LEFLEKLPGENNPLTNKNSPQCVHPGCNFSFALLLTSQESARVVTSAEFDSARAPGLPDFLDTIYQKGEKIPNGQNIYIPFGRNGCKYVANCYEI
jgi:hypothetical protein